MYNKKEREGGERKERYIIDGKGRRIEKEGGREESRIGRREGGE